MQGHLGKVGEYVQDQLAFTAKYWGDLAVVDHAAGGRLSPVADQEFEAFEPWAQGNAFAARRNAGRQTSPIKSRKMAIRAMLRASEVLRSGTTPCVYAIDRAIRFLEDHPGGVESITARPERLQAALQTNSEGPRDSILTAGTCWTDVPATSEAPGLQGFGGRESGNGNGRATKFPSWAINGGGFCLA
jgi:hypothetical protein